MSSTETGELVELFVALENASTVKEKSNLLSKAKFYILKEMTDSDIKSFFIMNQQNFENLFLLNIWTKSLEDNNGIVDYTESYDIIEKIFKSIDSLNEFVNLFYSHIIFILNQENDEKVKHILVQQFKKFVKCFDLSAYENQLMIKNEIEEKIKVILIPFVKQISNTTVHYTELLAELFCELTIKFDKLESKIQNEYQRVHVFSCSVFDNNPDLLNEFEKISNISSIMSFRVFEIFVKLAIVSKEHLVNISESKFNLSNKIDTYLNQNSDILAKLNCIELLSNLIRTNHGYVFFEKTGHLKHIVNLLDKINTDPTVSLLVPSVIKFFSHIAIERPIQSKENFPIFYRFIYEYSINENLVQNLEFINLSIQTYAFLFESNLFKKFYIENFGNETKKFLERLIWLIKNTIKDKLKSNSLLCLAELISPDSCLLDTYFTDQKWINSPWITSEWINLAYLVYNKITSEIIPHENLFNLCLGFAKEPFAEQRLSGQLYFKALAQTEWGLQLLFTPNKFNCEESFLDGYLLNRSIELEKKGLESKLELIKLIVANLEVNKHLINIIGDIAYEKLKQYLREGAFFVRAQAQVAFESV